MSRASLTVAIVSFSYSGVSHYAYCLASKLTGLENSSKTILISNKRHQFRGPCELELAAIFSRTRWLPLELMQFIRFIFHKKVDIVHFQSFLKYPFLTYLLIRLFQFAGKRVVFTAHDVLPHYPRFYHKKLMKMIYESADAVVAHSQHSRDAILAFAKDVRCMNVIPHGLYDMFHEGETVTRAEARKILQVPDQAYILLFFGRLDKRKGADLIVRQLHSLVERERDIFLLMAGTTAYPTGYLTELAADSGVSGHIMVFERWISDSEVATFFSAADAVILPYLEGSTSGVIKIALAFGKPVIATRVGDLPETIEHTGSGILIDIPFSDEDVEKIVLLVNGKLQAKYFQSSDSPHDYSWEQIASKTDALYQAISGDA